MYTDTKSEGKVPKDEFLSSPFEKFVETANKVATIMTESNIDMKKEEYVKKFAPEMMEITYSWCQGAKFSEICEMSETIFEGTIIRSMRRLDELISQLVEAAKVIGNNELRDKFMESQGNIKRGIIFAASLYL